MPRLQDFADSEVLFEAREEDKGLLTCRVCGRHVGIWVRFTTILFLKATRATFQGNWCNHAPLREKVGNIIVNSMNRIENEGFF